MQNFKRLLFLPQKKPAEPAIPKNAAMHGGLLISFFLNRGRFPQVRILLYFSSVFRKLIHS
jgi:hypothetical protein